MSTTTGRKLDVRKQSRGRLYLIGASVLSALVFAGCIQQGTPISSEPPPPPIQRAIGAEGDSPPVIAEDYLSPAEAGGDGVFEEGVVVEGDIVESDEMIENADQSLNTEEGYISSEIATSVFADVTPLSSNERTEVFSLGIEGAREARLLVYEETQDAIQGEIALNEIALPILLTERVENVLLIASPKELRRSEALRISLQGAKARLAEIS